MIKDNSLHYQVEGIETTKMKTLTGDVVEKLKAAITVVDDTIEGLDDDNSSFRYPFKLLIQKNKDKVQYTPKQEEVYDFLKEYKPKDQEEFNHDLNLLFKLFNDPIMHEECQHLLAKETYQLIPLTFKQEDMFSDDYIASYNIKYQTGAGEWTVSEVRATVKLDDEIKIQSFETKDVLLKELKEDIIKDIHDDLEEYLYHEQSRGR